MSEGYSLSVDPEGDVVGQLGDHIRLLNAEAQDAFAEDYAEYQWRVDLSDPAVFWFQREPPAMFRPRVIGTHATDTDTWLWSWENINGLPDSVVEVSEQILDVGRRSGAVEFTTARLPIDQGERRRAGLPFREEPVHDYVRAAMAVSGSHFPVYYRAPSGPTHVWMLLDNVEEFALAPASIATSVGLIGRYLGAGALSDPRLAIRAYGSLRGGLTVRDDGPDLILEAGDGRARVSFDELGRVVRIGVEAGGER